MGIIEKLQQYKSIVDNKYSQCCDPTTHPTPPSYCTALQSLSNKLDEMISHAQQFRDNLGKVFCDPRIKAVISMKEEKTELVIRLQNKLQDVVIRWFDEATLNELDPLFNTLDSIDCTLEDEIIDLISEIMSKLQQHLLGVSDKIQNVLNAINNFSSMVENFVENFSNIVKVHVAIHLPEIDVRLPQIALQLGVDCAPHIQKAHEARQLAEQNNLDPNYVIHDTVYNELNCDDVMNAAAEIFEDALNL